MIKVSRLEWLGQYRIRFLFSDGTGGEHDFSEMVAEEGAMLLPLRDEEYFGRVFLDDGAPTWPNGFDMAPRWIQMELEARGALRRVAA